MIETIRVTFAGSGNSPKMLIWFFFIKGCFGQHSSIISTVYSQLGDDCID